MRNYYYILSILPGGRSVMVLLSFPSWGSRSFSLPVLLSQRTYQRCHQLTLIRLPQWNNQQLTSSPFGLHVWSCLTCAWFHMESCLCQTFPPIPDMLEGLLNQLGLALAASSPSPWWKRPKRWMVSKERLLAYLEVHLYLLAYRKATLDVGLSEVFCSEAQLTLSSQSYRRSDTSHALWLTSHIDIDRVLLSFHIWFDLSSSLSSKLSRWGDHSSFCHASQRDRPFSTRLGRTWMLS